MGKSFKRRRVRIINAMRNKLNAAEKTDSDPLSEFKTANPDLSGKEHAAKEEKLEEVLEFHEVNTPTLEAILQADEAKEAPKEVAKIASKKKALKKPLKASSAKKSTSKAVPRKKTHKTKKSTK
tara:strand:+ start:567 stop:938 length:372 start_codon:yes stop_codon:yes gene_type:complete